MISGGCLRLGHVDGKNRVYDSEGALILRPDEELLSVHQNVQLDVSESWRSFYVKSVFFLEAGPVLCYLTSQRVVFLRLPDARKAGAHLMTPYGAPTGIAESYKAQRILEAGGYEYFEVEVDDIRFCRMNGYRFNLFIASGGKKLRATLGTARARPALRDPLMSLIKDNRIPPR